MMHAKQIKDMHRLSSHMHARHMAPFSKIIHRRLCSACRHTAGQCEKPRVDFFAKTSLSHLLGKKGLGPGTAPDLRAGVEELVPVNLQHVGRLDPTGHEHGLSDFDVKGTKSHITRGGPRFLVATAPDSILALIRRLPSAGGRRC